MVIDIVIPSRTDDRNVLCLLDSISNLEPTFLGTVSLVFNPQLPSNLPILKKYSFRLQIFSIDSANVNKARNFGLKNCSGDWALLIDSDCVINDPHLLMKYVDLIHQNPGAQIIGGGYTSPEGSQAVVRAYHWIQQDWYLSGQQHSGENRNLLGGNLAISCEIYKNFFFDEDIAFGASETEFIYRLNAQGVKTIGAPVLSVLHKPTLSVFSLIKKAYLQGFNTERFVQRFPQRGPVISALGLHHRANLPPCASVHLILWLYKKTFLFGYFSRQRGLARGWIALVSHQWRIVLNWLISTAEFLIARLRRLS